MVHRLIRWWVVLLVAGCASLAPHSVTLSEQDIAALLAREFPRQHRVLDIFDVTVTAPRVHLVPDRNRIATDLEFSAADRLTGRPLRGTLALDYTLRFEPSDATVRLAQVRVDRVSLESGNNVLPLPAQRVGGLLAEHVLGDAVIWRAKPEQVQQLRARGVSSGVVNVTPRGVVISLGS